MSIRDFDNEKNDIIIKHYRIRKKDTGGVFISPKRTFDNIMALVDHYKSEYSGGHIGPGLTLGASNRWRVFVYMGPHTGPGLALGASNRQSVYVCTWGYSQALA